MLQPLTAATVYFAIVFAAGFLLGFIRVQLIAPRIGELMAVLIEVPVMLAVSWLACRLVIRHFAVPSSIFPRLLVGTLAFAFLMMAEMAISTFAFGLIIGQHLGAFQTVAAQIGLGAQNLFALFPAIQLATRRDSSRLLQ